MLRKPATMTNLSTGRRAMPRKHRSELKPLEMVDSWSEERDSDDFDDEFSSPSVSPFLRFIPRKCRRWCRRNKLVAILAACTVLLVMYERIQPPLLTTIEWARPEWKVTNNLETCQTTLYQPLRVGCPDHCDRTDVSLNETLYRMNAAWYFGQAQLFDEAQLPSAYEKGINYQCPRSFVGNFLKASQELQDAVADHVTADLEFKPQVNIHMSLAYFCCLHRNETDWVRETLYDWVAERRPFDFSVEFHKLECWQERHNSITNVLVGDTQTQRAVMGLVHDLYKTIEKRTGIALTVKREQQMPFHITLGGFHLGKGDSSELQHNITPHIPAIHSIVSNLSAKYGKSWLGGATRKRMRVNFDPRYSSKGTWHAGPEPVS